MGGSFIGYEVLYTDQIPTTPIRLGQLLVDESEAAPLDMLKYCSSLSPLTYTSFSDGILPLIPVGANPTASVGLSAVNGSALTFMRSDAAPPLDVGISPTWTGAHTWTGASPLVIGADNKELRFGAGGDDLSVYHDGSNNYIDSNTGSLYLRGDPSTGAALRVVSSANGSLILSGARPGIFTEETDGATNEKSWAIVQDAGSLIIRCATDGFSVSNIAAYINRSGTTPTLFRVVPPFRADSLDTTGALVSGTYTPTLTSGANVTASTAHVCQYMRVGNTVTVSGLVEIDPTTATTATSLGMSLPIASNFASADQCGGAGADSAFAATAASAWTIRADAANDRAQFDCPACPTNANRIVTFSFSYLIV